MFVLGKLVPFTAGRGCECVPHSRVLMAVSRSGVLLDDLELSRKGCTDPEAVVQ